MLDSFSFTFFFFFSFFFFFLFFSSFFRKTSVSIHIITLYISMVRAEGNYSRLTVVEEIIWKRERERLVSILDLIFVKVESSMQLTSEI